MINICPTLLKPHASYLHPYDPVDEEYESDEDGDPREGLEGLEERPQKRPDALALGEELDQSHHAEKAKEVDGDHVAARLENAWNILTTEIIPFLSQTVRAG